jgi:hypothetical protein
MRDWRWVEVCLGSRRRRRSLGGASAGYEVGRGGSLQSAIELVC